MPILEEKPKFAEAATLKLRPALTLNPLPSTTDTMKGADVNSWYWAPAKNAPWGTGG